MNKIIHQIWIADSEDMMPCNLRILSNTWKKYNPDWDYHLWCSAEVESLLFSDFSDFYLLYKSVFTQRQRLNLAKYMILYLHGGLYVNLDTECFQSISPLFNDSQLFFTNQKDIVIC
jgi:mannosyltransferase OCH1-like enzyme